MSGRYSTAGANRFCLAFLGRPVIWPVLAVSLFFVLSSCSGAKTGKTAGGDKAKAAPLPVTVARSSQRDMPVEIGVIGSVQPFASVRINSQVEGILEKVNFREGDRVKAGDLLFVIDSRPFAARFDQARAALARDRAALGNARRQAERYLPAAKKGYVSEEQSDQAQTSVATLSAAVQADEAAVESARLDLDHCTIRAPISGYTGDLLVDRGNLVKAAADQPLVTINQVSPIKVSFNLPEQSLPELKKRLAAGGLEVRVSSPGSRAAPLSGRFAFLDNTVDPDTGTIRLKAVFANSDGLLWPGQFVNVRLRLTVRKDATVVPAEAIQTGQNGAYVYVVAKDLTVEERAVTVGFAEGGLAVIDSGLAVGETVVTDGQLRLKPGVTIKTVPAGKADAPEAKQ